ncbi:MAG: DNA polymerase/3'-5' exonuclease PolX [Candidatus Spechtbacterales bacterium]|nr:DNA polymerase/3'-5' exonuclease PolX [Candidatus Spechtbacterales bacterium]
MPSNINRELAHIFEEMGIIYEIKEDKFRSRAYHRAALTMDNLPRDAKKVYKKDGIEGLKKLPGVGQSTAEKIEQYIKTGHVKEYEKLKKDVPVELEELTAVEGVGPKAVKAFYDELGIKNLKDLEKVAKEGKIKELDGFGEKSEKKILQGIDFAKQSGGRKNIGEVLPYARELLEEIKNIQGVKKADIAGSLRRRQETIGDVDILVAAKDPKKVFDHVEKLPRVEAVLGRGETKMTVHLRRAFDIDIRAVEEDSYGAALQYFTGSKEHNVKVRQIAIDKGYKLNEYGLLKGKKNIAPGTDECDIYKKLGMQCPPPELRTDSGEIDAAGKDKLPELIKYSSLKGDLQIQTKWTDGKNTIEEYAKAAKERGLEYIAITDHTKNLAMTGGLDEKRLLKHKAEVEEVDKKIKGIKILSGVECDILKDGSLDIEDEVLKQLDVVGISVHSYFNLSQREQTKRVIKAISNPHADIFFHPTARRINKRPAIDLDMEKVINTAKEQGTVLEINAHPERLDLKDEHIRMAVEAGVKMVISSDAHSIDGLGVLEYGIAQARRGWAGADDIINTLPVEEFLKMLK